MNPILNIHDLTKSYGKKIALQNVTFSVKAGSCFGLLGPNGAGKSTAMKILTGILTADRGSIKLFGMNLSKERDAIWRYVGYVPQEITLYDQLSAYDNLLFFGQTYKVPGKELKERIGEVLEATGLTERAKDAIKTFSGGMKRRINIASALLHRPKLLILDEPTVGIDPQSRNHIFEMIRNLKKEGVTIIYSTHYMEEVEALCDEIAIIDHGKVMAQGSLEELLDRYARKAVYVEASELKEAPTLLHATKMYPEGYGWTIEAERVPNVMQEILKTALEKSWDVKRLEVIRPSLEDVFLTVTGTALRD